MSEARCMRCRANKEIKNPEEVIMKKTGMRAIRGICPDCGTKMYRILKKEVK